MFTRAEILLRSNWQPWMMWTSADFIQEYICSSEMNRKHYRIKRSELTVKSIIKYKRQILKDNKIFVQN